MSKFFQIIIVSVLLSIAASSLATYLIMRSASEKDYSENNLIKNYYATESVVSVSPHGLRKDMGKGLGDFILVDLRSKEEYEKEHIAGAVNIPAYSDPDTSAYGDKERIVKSFSELDENKDIIVYCYSTPCMTGRKIGKLLADNDIYVKHLGIGWNEWRYFWNTWNHEHEWDITNVDDYVSGGSLPGKVNIDGEDINPDACSIDGDFGC